MIQRQFQGQGTIGNVTEQGVQLDEARPDTDNVARSFEIFLNQTLRGIYVTFTKALDEDLRRVVEPAIFHQDSAFLTHNQPHVPCADHVVSCHSLGGSCGRHLAQVLLFSVSVNRCH